MPVSTDKHIHIDERRYWCLFQHDGDHAPRGPPTKSEPGGDSNRGVQRRGTTSLGGPVDGVVPLGKPVHGVAALVRRVDVGRHQLEEISNSYDTYNAKRN